VWAASLPECYTDPIEACLSHGAAAAPSKAASGAAAASAAADPDASDSDQELLPGSGAPRSGGPPATAAASASSMRHKYHQLYWQRRAYGDAWLALLRLPAARDTAQRILLALPTLILPQMPDRYPLLWAQVCLLRITRGRRHGAYQEAHTCMLPSHLHPLLRTLSPSSF
jgi:hypothetical protein